MFTASLRNTNQLTVTRLKRGADRRGYLSDKKVCFNRTGTRHRSVEYRCTTIRRRCNGKHNNSICDKLSNQLMLAIGEGRAQYPVVVVEVDGIRCSALLNIEAGSSDASAVLISKRNRKPDRRKYKRIEMMITWTNQKIEMHKVQVSAIERVLSLPTTQSKKDIGTLLTILNPMWISAPSTNSSRVWRLMTPTSSPNFLYTTHDPRG